jgi:hypothetical protein
MSHLCRDAFVGFMVVAALADCSARDGALEPETLGTSSQRVVGGNGAQFVTPFSGPNASETSTLVANNGNVVVAFNYEDDVNVTYTTSTDPNQARTVRHGTSEIGWNYSNGPYGGFNTPGRPQAPRRVYRWRLGSLMGRSGTRPSTRYELCVYD